MRKIIIISIIMQLIFIVSCTVDSNPINSEEPSYNYELSYQFRTQNSPKALALDDENEFIYVINDELGFSSGQKFQKYNFSGVLQSTLEDFNYNQNGRYSKYSLIDITLDNNKNICLLLKPYYKYSLHEEEGWMTYNGFCIMLFNPNGQFLEELDYSMLNNGNYSNVITFYNNAYYVVSAFYLFKIPKHSKKIIEIPFPEDNRYAISDIVVKSNENIWCTGTMFSGNQYENYEWVYVSKLNSELKSELKFKSNTHNNSCFSSALINQSKIVLDEKNNIYLCTGEQGSVEIYNSTGELLGDYDFSKIIKNTYLRGIGIDKAKRVYVLDSRNDAIYVLKNKKL